MFTACFDASGCEDDEKHIAVGGFISSENEWAEFSREWKTRLGVDGVSFFRMSDFRHSRGPFNSEWKEDESRRQQLLGDLMGLIKTHAYRKFGCVLEIASFHHHISEANRNHFRLNSFVWAARTAAEQVRQWARAEHICTPIKYVFEDGDKGKGLLRARMEQDWFPIPLS